MKKIRIIGTSMHEISTTESIIGFSLPNDFISWLLINNGKDLGRFRIFPVFDARDPRKTWDSIDRNWKTSWIDWLSHFDDGDKSKSELLPFADFGTGDYICFDYSKESEDGKFMVAVWSHETNNRKYIANSFSEFIELIPTYDF